MDDFHASPLGMSITSERVIPDLQVAKAARYLVRLATQDGGYTVCGVCGWAHPHDVGRAIRMRMDGQLPRLYASNLAERVNLTSATGLYWLYRVTDAGEGPRGRGDRRVLNV